MKGLFSAATVGFIALVTMQILSLSSFWFNYKFFDNLAQGKTNVSEVESLSKVYLGLFSTSMIILLLGVIGGGLAVTIRK
jgi:hypothetical protein